MIFNQTADKYFDPLLRRISLKTSIDVDLSFDKTFVRKLKYPYSECKFEFPDQPDSIYAKALKEESPNSTYSKSICNEIGRKLTIRNKSMKFMILHLFIKFIYKCLLIDVDALILQSILTNQFV